MIEKLNSVAFRERVLGPDGIRRSERPAVVYVYDAWADATRWVTDLLEDIRWELPGVDFYRVDRAAEPDVAALGPKYIPFFLMVPVDRRSSVTIGVSPRDRFVEHIRKSVILPEEVRVPGPVCYFPDDDDEEDESCS